MRLPLDPRPNLLISWADDHEGLYRMLSRCILSLHPVWKLHLVIPQGPGIHWLTLTWVPWPETLSPFIQPMTIIPYLSNMTSYDVLHLFANYRGWTDRPTVLNQRKVSSLVDRYTDNPFPVHRMVPLLTVISTNRVRYGIMASVWSPGYHQVPTIFYYLSILTSS